MDRDEYKKMHTHLLEILSDYRADFYNMAAGKADGIKFRMIVHLEPVIYVLWKIKKVVIK